MIIRSVLSLHYFFPSFFCTHWIIPGFDSQWRPNIFNPVLFKKPVKERENTSNDQF